MWAGVHEIKVVELCTAPSDCGSVDGSYQDLWEIDQDLTEEAGCFDFLFDCRALAGGR